MLTSRFAMFSRGLIASLAVLVCAALVARPTPSQEPVPGPEKGTIKRRPNVVLVITDDQGYGDLGVHGNEKIRTPNLDRLARESVSLTDYHVDPTCSPSRSALLTGRYSTRTGVWHTIMGRSLMAGTERTMAECFRDNGYRTGMFGKWHLGDNAPCRPQDQGFERAVWHHGGGVGQGPDYWGNDYFDDTYEVDGEWRKFDGYCTDVWFEQAEEFIRREDARPFFVYLATNAPHGPYLVADKYSRPYREAGVAKTMANFYGMITNIDENVGRLRALLRELGLADNTVFVFTTDNGTAAGHAKRAREQGTWPGYSAGMRGHKGSEYDGGHRVPFLVRWPDGSVGSSSGEPRKIEELLAHVDVLPTLSELCGLQADAGEQPDLPAELDGKSFAAALQGLGAAPQGRTLFVHSQRIEHPRMWRKCAVMTDRWRLVNGRELYDIEADPGQRSDLAAQQPQVVNTLRQEYVRWWTSLQPSFADFVRIDLGGVEDPVELMSHDWHTNNRGTPWHQNHVRNGYLGKGPWAVNVRRAGRYRITLWRWPQQLQKAMQCVAAEVRFGSGTGREVSGRRDLDPSATHASFDLELPAGPQMLHTLLRRANGDEHGAYFASVRWLP